MPPARRGRGPGERGPAARGPAPASSRAQAPSPTHAPARATGPARERTRRPRRTQHSLESILQAAIAVLDEAGVGALTFRELAGRLGTGVGSIYWYVAGKDELLDRASDEVLAPVLVQTRRLAQGPDPIANLRAMALTLFDAMQQHPWLGSFLLRNVAVQPNSLTVYELFGQQLLQLDLTPQQRFYGVSAVISYVTGVGTEMSQAPSGLEDLDEVDRGAFLAGFADVWRATDPDEFPFLHEAADEFAAHADEDQFAAGLDLLLAGLRGQAGRTA